MASILDFSKFSFSVEEIRAVKELIFDEVIESPELSLFATVYPGIVYDKEVGFVGEGGLVGVAGQGCDPEPQDYNIGTRVVRWEPKNWEILIHQCAKDLEDTAGLYSLKTGIAINDFTASDYMAIIVEVLSKNVKEFVIRLVWFNDVDADNTIIEKLPTAAVTEQTAGQAIAGTVYAGVTSETVDAVKCALANGTVVYLNDTAAVGNAQVDTIYYSKDTVNKTTVYSGGDITPGAAVKYFNIINGFFKQMEIQITGNAEQHVAIAENAGATYVAQRLTPANVRDVYLPGLIYDANMILRGMDNGVILCTQSFYDGYSKSLKGISLSELYVNLTEGIKVLTYDGIPLVPMKIWDKIIKTYYNNGARLLNPHRAVYVTKDILAVGVDSESSFGDLDIWYNKDSRKVKMESMGKADAKLLNPELFQIAI
ncbi:MAG: hypothetical protein BGO29_14795 [Bacteroidales bacterium 36-12]|nr:MAG: hypothetical protein BGO29_14795 [Bacteroidales bacterium 36-12]